MRFLLCLLALTVPAWPQATEPKPAAKGSSDEERPVSIRRFSMGGTFSYAPVNMLFAGSYNQTLTNIDGYVTAISAVHSHRAAGGVTMQFALAERWTVNVNALYRSAGYSADYKYQLGFDKPTTVVDERNTSSITDVASARYWDIPVLLRYYASGRHDRGGHYFIEAGPSLRLVRSARFSRDVATPDGTVTTYDKDYDVKQKNIPGFTVGMGRQFKDAFGVRVIPEMRFTQWMNSTFNTAPVRSSRSQIEFLVSLTF